MQNSSTLHRPYILNIIIRYFSIGKTKLGFDNVTHPLAIKLDPPVYKPLKFFYYPILIDDLNRAGAITEGSSARKFLLRPEILK